MKIIGVYTITNTVNNKIYIGKSNDVKGRWNYHVWRLKNNKHNNFHLQSAWNKFGKNVFKFSIIEECKEEDLFNREYYWITTLNTINTKIGYNIEYSQLNGTKIVSEETRQKIGNASRGRKQTKESIEKMINTKKERGTGKHSEETKKKLSELQKGRKSPMKGIPGKQRREFNHGSVPVYCYDIAGVFLKRYTCCAEAAEELLLSKSKVIEVKNKKRNHAKGYRFFKDYMGDKIETLKLNKNAKTEL
jgi:group I intron endonuclease